MINITKLTIITFLVAAILFPALSAQAGWLIYHKPEFRGKVVDIDTKEPIEGAVVVAIYRKRTMGLGAGTISSIIEIKEALTDKDGLFRIPSYTTVIQPFSWEIPCTFIVYKSGYARAEDFGLESILIGKTTKDLEISASWDKDIKFRYLISGVIELPRVTTRQERLRALPGHITEAFQLTPLFNNIIENEEKELSLK